MKPNSRKAKGRALQNYVADQLREKTGLTKDDIRTAIMGESGTDIKLSSRAKRFIPFDIECKNQERLNIWKAISQAEANTQDNRIPLVVFKRNRSKVYAIIRFEELVKLW